MKKEILLLMIAIVLISGVSAIRINEVEMNPIGGSSGNEWIELYNDKNTEVDISGWEVWEGLSKPKKIFTIPNETIIQKDDFYVIELDNARTLNNAGDFVTLYDLNSNKIDETETLKDEKNNDKTNQYCNGVWEFLESTKNSENNCSKETDTYKESTTQTIEETTKSETTSNKKEDSSSEKEVTYEPLAEEIPSSIKLETITLNPKVIKTENNNEEIGKSYAFYGFVAFSIFLGVLFIIRKNRYKNEFK